MKSDSKLGQRAIACSKWRWMPGMLDSQGFRLLRVILHDGSWWAENENHHPELDKEATRYYYPKLPDLTDPATLGCLLSLIREAWGNKIVVSQGNGWFEVETDYSTWDNDNTPSFVDALVDALESAP